MATIHISETWINATDADRREHCGESDIYDTGRDTSELGTLYRELRREYGRCTGRVYVDMDGRAIAVGWVFLKRRPFEDSPGTWLMETWITLHTAPDTVTRTPHYLVPAKLEKTRR